MPKLTVEGIGEFEVPAGKRLVLALTDEAGVDQLHACGGGAIGNPVNCVSGILERHRNRLANHLIVFNEQNAHESSNIQRVSFSHPGPPDQGREECFVKGDQARHHPRDPRRFQ